MEAFFQSIGLATSLSGLNVPGDRLEEMADKGTGGDTSPLGNFVKLGKKDVVKVLELALN
jgi:alcohol dehydrogenase YqhD (iron-dependent ADH family)